MAVHSNKRTGRKPTLAVQYTRSPLEMMPIAEHSVRTGTGRPSTSGTIAALIRQIVARSPNQDVEVYSVEGRRRSSNTSVRRRRAGHLKDIRQDLQYCWVTDKVTRYSDWNKPGLVKYCYSWRAPSRYNLNISVRWLMEVIGGKATQSQNLQKFKD